MNIIDKFHKIATTCISDALHGLENLRSAIKPLKEEQVVHLP